MKKYFYISLGILLVLFLVVGFEVYKQKDNSEKMIMGVSLDYPPFEFIKDGIPVGYSVDLAHLIAKKLGVELEIKDMDFNSLIPALNSNQVDFIISSMSATEERKRSVDFTIPYYKSYAKIIMNKSKEPKSIDFNKMMIGVQMGSTMENYLKESRKNNAPNVKIIAISRIPQLIEELKIGRVDAIIVDADNADRIVKGNSNFITERIEDFNGSNSVVLPKNSPRLEKFNEIIAALEAKGQLALLQRKWVSNQ